MQKWSKKHAEFVGRIIFANFLELPLEGYKNIIRETEQFICHEGGVSSSVDTRRLSKANTSSEKSNRSLKAVAEIVKSGNSFSVKYTYDDFNRIYLIDRFFNRKNQMDQQSRSILFRLRRISSRNELTHGIIQGIIEHQKKFLSTCDPTDLAPFSEIQLVKWLKVNKPLQIDVSWISRLVNRLSVIIPSGEERLLKAFFRTQKHINKRLMKQLLDEENEDIESEQLKNPLTDKEIRTKLEDEHGIKLSRHSICIYRKELGIPSSRRRLSGYKYPPLSANFSMPYPLTIESVESNAPANSGVYEFCLTVKEIEYPNGKTRVTYIGSTMNVKKRLKEHLGKNSKNGQIRNFLNKYGCFFRYIQLSGNWKEEEKKLYKLFVTTYGSAPKCNRVSP